MRRVLLVAGFPIVSFGLTIVLLHALVPVYHSPPAARLVSKVEKTQVVRTEPPARLEIASIKVVAAVKPVGITDQGDMAIDESMVDVAWYKKGPMPGEKGSAVIAGHYGWKGSQGSVFNDLHTLKAGDKVSVYDAKGGLVSFSVRKIQKYDPASDATDVFQSNDGKAHLNLITCDGSWNNNLQTYSKRLVVFTDKEV